MRIHLLAVGRRMPEWVQTGYAEFARRMPPECRLVLSEIEPGERSKGRDPGSISLSTSRHSGGMRRANSA